tara:strand:+ start:392 stop:607 length:216 start_codon:yes stop_codon:yes gene_type:complete
MTDNIPLYSKVKNMTDNELTYAMNDIRETLKRHKVGTTYHKKLMQERDFILNKMSGEVVKEYIKIYMEEPK